MSLSQSLLLSQFHALIDALKASPSPTAADVQVPFAAHYNALREAALAVLGNNVVTEIVPPPVPIIRGDMGQFVLGRYCEILAYCLCFVALLNAHNA